MKRGRKSKAELAALAKRPAGLRAPWQIEQGQRCGCGGSDDMCPCQNETPWPRPTRDLEAELQAAQSEVSALKEEVERLKVRADYNLGGWVETHNVLHAQVASLQSLIAEKDAALEPFALLYDESRAPFHDGSVRPHMDLSREAWGFNNAAVKWADFHRARTALNSTEAKTGGAS